MNLPTHINANTLKRESPAPMMMTVLNIRTALLYPYFYIEPPIIDPRAIPVIASVESKLSFALSSSSVHSNWCFNISKAVPFAARVNPNVMLLNPIVKVSEIR